MTAARPVFYVSDGTGITAETIGHSLLTQFSGSRFATDRLPFVDTVDKARSAAVRIRDAGVAAGLRPVSSSDQMKKVVMTLKSRARTSRGMWSRRAQEYEAKINSGNIFFIAEVVRDLHQNVDQSERSYSERMIYESALARLVGEFAAAEGFDHKTATDKLMKLLRAKVAAAAAAVTKEAA